MRHNLAPAQPSPAQHPPRCVMGSKVSSEPGAALLPFVAFDQLIIKSFYFLLFLTILLFFSEVKSWGAEAPLLKGDTGVWGQLPGLVCVFIKTRL